MSTIGFGKYLLTRIKELGISDVFGVPGDFNLHFLDDIEDDQELTWRGATNELNGAYAADGYARIKGAALFVSTCGVGELSAHNAFAGSFAEQVPVIHLVGVPATTSYKAGRILHHQLGPDHKPNLFPDLWKACTVAQVNVNQKTTAEELDAALETCMRRNQPIYISLPQDLVNMPMDAGRLTTTPLNTSQPENWDALEAIVIDHLIGLVKGSEAPIILCDAGANRDNVQAEVDELLRALPHVPYFVSAMGKSSVNEHYPNYAGVFAGNLSLESVNAAFRSADLVIFIGHLAADLNTGLFSLDTTHQKVVELHAAYTLVRGGKFEQVGMKKLLPKLIAAIRSQDKPITSTVKIPTDLGLPFVPPPSPTETLSYAFFWKRIEDYLREGDILCAEPGTCGFGVLDLKLPRNATIVVQYLWASIGFGTAALVGASVANSHSSPAESRGRVVAFCGDGSFQMTAQEISSLIRHKLDATIFLINNRGYCVEKYLHGAKKTYNLINDAWRYGDTLRYFGGGDDVIDVHYSDDGSEFTTTTASTESSSDGSSKKRKLTTDNPSTVVDSKDGDQWRCYSYVIATTGALDALLKDPQFCSRKGIKFVEIHMPEYDGGRLLTSLARTQGRYDEVDGVPVDFNEFGQPYQHHQNGQLCEKSGVEGNAEVNVALA